MSIERHFRDLLEDTCLRYKGYPIHKVSDGYEVFGITFPTILEAMDEITRTYAIIDESTRKIPAQNQDRDKK